MPEYWTRRPILARSRLSITVSLVRHFLGVTVMERILNALQKATRPTARCFVKRHQRQFLLVGYLGSSTQ